MARRRPRRPGAPAGGGRTPVAARGGWVYWLAVLFVGLLVIIMIVTMLPTGI
jgi:hypothetical protein